MVVTKMVEATPKEESLNIKTGSSTSSTTTTSSAFRSAGINVIAGGGAGLFESFLMHPLDTIKTRLQLQTTSSLQYRNAFHCASTILKQEGVLAFYKGLTPVACGLIPKNALRFTAFDQITTQLNAISDYLTGHKDKEGEEDKNKNNSNNNKKVSTGIAFLGGLLTGCIEATLIVTPSELVKIRLQDQKGTTNLRYKGLVHGVVTILQEGGVKELYKGLGPTILRQAGNQSVKFSAYWKIKSMFLATGDHPSGELPFLQQCIAGGGANAIAVVVNTPFDVMKTRMQKVDAPRTMRQCFSNLYQNEGFRAFFKGLTPRLLRLVPGGAIQFGIWQEFVKMLR